MFSRREKKQSQTLPSFHAVKVQSQASLKDQLEQLIVVAHREGLYDAADWIRTTLESRRSATS